MSIFSELAAPFAPEAIRWRAQSVSTKKPDEPKAMALAYIDARDVMNRLDEVCGPDGWEDSLVETALGRVICTIRIRCGDVWISKSDGAGKTDIEGDKGGLSDAFKRAAVKWGIGRYLYDMPTPWVRCELYNGKWSNWTKDGLAELHRIAGRQAPPPPRQTVSTVDDSQRDHIATLAQAAGVPLIRICEAAKIKDLRELPASEFEAVRKKLNLTIEQNSKQKELA